MNYKDAILKRISRRSFLETPIDAEKIEALKEKINAANTQSGLSISFLEDGGAAFSGSSSYGMFSGVRSLILLKGQSGLEHLREKAGYYGERLILDATCLGLGTCWVGGTFNKAKLNVPESEELICVIPVGNVREQSSIKEKLLRGALHRKSKTVEELLITDEPISDELRRAVELVQRAPTTRNQQKAVFQLKNGEITAHVPETYHLDLVDLGICKLHMECGTGGIFELGNRGRLCR